MNGVSIFSVDHAKRSNLAIFGTACFLCSKIPSGEMVQCPVCQRLSYCSIDCFQADIEFHKIICAPIKIVATPSSATDLAVIFKRGHPPYELEPDIGLLFQEEATWFQRILMYHLKVDCTPVHLDLLLYKPRCAICMCSAYEVRIMYEPEYKSLLHCPDCRASFTCSERHRALHSDEHRRDLERDEEHTECEMNKRAFQDSLEIVSRGWTMTDTLWFPVRHKSEYAPLPSSWAEWFADPSNLCPPDSSAALNRVRTKQLSIPMTILYGMEQFDREAGDLPLLSSRTELEIAVVGAWEYELLFGGLTVFEEILHCLPSLRRLTLRFVGPEVVHKFIGPNGEERETLEWTPCALCKDKGVEIVHSIHPALFHEYVEEHTTKAAAGEGPEFQWPDLAVTFNSGMGLSRHLESGWSPTVEMLAKNNVPTICTSFIAREAEEDNNFLGKHHCDIVFGYHKNPWRSEVVTKMVQSRRGFFSYNNYVQGFRGWSDAEFIPRWSVLRSLEAAERRYSYPDVYHR
ncbi:hypothetical protein SCHPADRAFT_510723 [Schizopora paradoxa]|uniref:MYND-type domain-containing protein n=1 Tax=Schizopora paradoxa TaxID=27342 RepID=A0A0H2RFL5_9AGAM|nr:hypothetical protein SCHPADRAFT_510723 [Schizopora paradoxa]